MYIIFLLTILFIKLFVPKQNNIELPNNIKKSFKIDTIILIALTILEIFILFSIVFKQKYIQNFFVKIPDIYRTVGVVVGYLGTIVISITMFKLKKVYSATLSIRNNHKLVKDGIYKYIRHPIYTGYLLLHIGVTLSLSNIIVAIVWIGGLIVFLFHRIPKEEELLEYYFGDEYIRYKSTTGLLFPKLSKK
ncbi:MAG: isoprenylcysteine carboxylmethyltransferase family protein [Ignavibacteria bacterium]|nr:isoprenylcysteine carboxylmethyltransferase family protein [Ignavibacteria bacterium]